MKQFFFLLYHPERATERKGENEATLHHHHHFYAQLYLRLRQLNVINDIVCLHEAHKFITFPK